METPSCGKCANWNETKVEAAFAGSGECRRYAPFPLSDIFNGAPTPFRFMENNRDRFASATWPVTDIVDWCGDFRMKDPTGVTL